MKCERCNLEFSETVFPHHIQRCNVKEQIEAKEAKIEEKIIPSEIEKTSDIPPAIVEEVKEYTDEQIAELRAKAKEAKIHNWHSKNPNTLVKELEALSKN